MTTFALPETLTHAQASVFAQRFGMDIKLREAVEEPKGVAVLVDASGLKSFDSSALALLLQCRRDAIAAGKTFEVIALPQKLRELARLYGIRELLGDSAT